MTAQLAWLIDPNVVAEIMRPARSRASLLSWTPSNARALASPLSPSGKTSTASAASPRAGDGTHVYPDELIRCQIDSDIINVAYVEGATNCGEGRSHIEGRIRTTAGQSGVSGTDIKAMPIPICSPAEQAEIVRILDGRLEAVDALQAEIDSGLARAEALRQSILKKSFAGELVPQDPTDEPAHALLARIRASRSRDSTKKPRRRARRRASTPLPP